MTVFTGLFWYWKNPLEMDFKNYCGMHPGLLPFSRFNYEFQLYCHHAACAWKSAPLIVNDAG